MVAGGPAATMAAAADGGAWRERGTEREGEGGEVHKHQEITRSKQGRSGEAGEDGRRRGLARRRRPEAERTATIRPNGTIPAQFHRLGG